MLAGVYDGNPGIKLIERSVPAIGPRQALLKVGACGVCGTDLRILASGHGRIPPGAERILGHELSGEIVEVGKEVDWPDVGTRVAIAPNMGCGHCENCIRGFTQLCATYISFGVVIDGAFAEYMLVPEPAFSQGNISPIPAGVSFEEAALNEPLSCVYHGLMACSPKPGETVLVVGAGPIGLIFTRVAEAVGAGMVILSEVSPERSEQAKNLGAATVINPLETDLKEQIFGLTGGRGVDIAVVAAPSSAAQSQVIDVLAYHGRVNFFGGLPKGSPPTGVDANQIHYRELTITGTTGQTVNEYRTTLQMLADGQVSVKDLVSACYPLDDIAAAIDYAGSRTGLKTIVGPVKTP
jgi:L-iditol 2-dehydrogenase